MIETVIKTLLRTQAQFQVDSEKNSTRLLRRTTIDTLKSKAKQSNSKTRSRRGNSKFVPHSQWERLAKVLLWLMPELKQETRGVMAANQFAQQGSFLLSYTLPWQLWVTVYQRSLLHRQHVQGHTKHNNVICFQNLSEVWEYHLP